MFKMALYHTPCVWSYISKTNSFYLILLLEYELLSKFHEFHVYPCTMSDVRNFKIFPCVLDVHINASNRIRTRKVG